MNRSIFQLHKSAAVLLKRFISLALVCALTCLLSCPFSFLEQKSFTCYASDNEQDLEEDDEAVRGIWISYGDYKAAGLYNKNEKAFRKNADKTFKLLGEYGFNTVYFHVRAFDDAIYPNTEYKWCEFLADEPTDYDALAILVEAAHKYNIKFHAWINPYRITHTKIYNPALQKTTDRIISGIMEIIQNYNVDGIHFDDYFYPSKSRGNQFYSVTIEKRKENINKMVTQVYSAIKDYNPEIEFGISPAGNIEYAESIGCDLETWLSNDGYVDYIIPQIYWSEDYIKGRRHVSLFEDTLFDWYYLSLGNTPFYTGLALYKAGYYSSADRGWQKSYGNIKSQVKLCEKYACDGYVMFSYQSLFTPDGKREMSNYMTWLTGLKVKKNSITLKRGKSYSLSRLVRANGKYPCTYKYTSSKKSVLKVNKNGVIQGVRRGFSIVTVKGYKNAKVRVKVKVK